MGGEVVILIYRIPVKKLTNLNFDDPRATSDIKQLFFC